MAAVAWQDSGHIDRSRDDRVYRSVAEGAPYRRANGLLQPAEKSEHATNNAVGFEQSFGGQSRDGNDISDLSDPDDHDHMSQSDINGRPPTASALTRFSDPESELDQSLKPLRPENSQGRKSQRQAQQRPSPKMPATDGQARTDFSKQHSQTLTAFRLDVVIVAGMVFLLVLLFLFKSPTEGYPDATTMKKRLEEANAKVETTSKENNLLRERLQETLIENSRLQERDEQQRERLAEKDKRIADLEDTKTRLRDECIRQIEQCGYTVEALMKEGLFSKIWNDWNGRRSRSYKQIAGPRI